jgi:hypothetical protein
MLSRKERRALKEALRRHSAAHARWTRARRRDGRIDAGAQRRGQRDLGKGAGAPPKGMLPSPRRPDRLPVDELALPRAERAALRRRDAERRRRAGLALEGTVLSELGAGVFRAAHEKAWETRTAGFGEPKYAYNRVSGESRWLEGEAEAKGPEEAE